MKLKSWLFIILTALSFELYALEYKTYSFASLARELGYPSETYYGCDQKEILDLETYSSKEDTFYKEINNYLRFFPHDYEWNGIGPKEAESIVVSIDKIFSRSVSLPQGLILFRGVNLEYRKNRSFAPGEEFLEKGYVSTSTSFKVASYFATEIDDSSSVSKKAIFVLYQSLPEHKGILIDQDEDEVLLKHGQLLKVMLKKKIKKNNNPVVDVYLVQMCKIRCDQQVNKEIKKFWNKF